MVDLTRWVKIFKGSKKATASEIAMEIQSLERKRASVKANLKDLRNGLKTKRLDAICGDLDAQVGVEDTKKAIAEDVEALENISIVVEKLLEKHKQAVNDEAETKISAIEAHLQELSLTQQDLTAKLLAASAQAAAYSYLLRGGTNFTIGPRQLPMAMPLKDAATFYDIYKELTENEESLPVKRIFLKEQISSLKSQR